MLAGEVTTLNSRVRTAMRPNEVAGATATREGSKTQEVPLDPLPLSTRIDQTISIGQPPICLRSLAEVHHLAMYARPYGTPDKCDASVWTRDASASVPSGPRAKPSHDLP